MSESRKSFVKLHEVGHDVLYWQHEILCCLDDDQTLDADVHEEFEEEANYFASVTLFQHDRFDSEMGKYELGINASLSTAKHFGASLHATLRRYVERSDKRCALLILENITPNGELPKCRVRNFLTSVKFEYEFGIIEWNETLGYKWPFVQLYYHKKRGVLTGHVELRTANGPIPFEFQFFNNSYNAFVLIFPVGENREIRNNIIFLPFA
jgi:hypothetical protein